MPTKSSDRPTMFETVLLATLPLLGLVPAGALAQPQLCGTPPGASIFYQADPMGNESRPLNCQDFFNCHCPEKVSGPVYEVSPPGCQGASQSCSVTVRVGLKVPGSHQNGFIGTHPQVYWFKNAAPTIKGTTGCCSESGSILRGPER